MHLPLPVPRSMTARLTLMMGLIALCVFGVAGWLLDRTLDRQLQAAEQDELRGKVGIVQHFVDMLGDSGDRAAMQRQLDDALMAHHHLRLWISDPAGTLWYGSGTAAPPLPADGQWTRFRGADGVELVGLRTGLTAQHGSGRFEMVIAADTRPRQALLRNYRLVLLAVCGLGVLVTAVVGGWAVRRGLAPLQRLSAQAERIAPDTLSIRLPAQGGAPELSGLATSFNRVLDRLELAYQQMEAFNADVAHELRTPLTTLINGAQIALTGSRTTEELREVLASSLEDLEQLKHLVNDMLFLARCDRGEPLADAVPVALEEEARRVVEYFDAACEERGVHLVVAGQARLTANPALLRRALVNLVANALHYTAAGGTIRIVIEVSAAGVRLAVRNPGPAIAAADLERLFDRFFRADPARAARGDSHGLGLAIVRAIARMHGGEVFAASNEGVTEIGLSLGGRVASNTTSAS